MNLPPCLDLAVYRRLHSDLRKLGDEALAAHYRSCGEAEGRTANALADRNAFAALAIDSGTVLEVGPFANPLLRGSCVRYCDVCDQARLRARAKSLGLDAEGVPTIDFVLGEAGLDAIDDVFDAVISSHCIEHQPDLVAHLQQVARRVRAREGRYFLLVPDKRYCFDRFIAESTIAEVLEAHEQRRRMHTLRSVIEHRALTTHNDARRHWSEASPERARLDATKVQAALDEWRRANGAYIDVHAWYFTPSSFAEMVDALNRLGLVALVLERLYATRRGSNEFWAVLKAQ